MSGVDWTAALMFLGTVAGAGAVTLAIIMWSERDR